MKTWIKRLIGVGAALALGGAVAATPAAAA